MSTPNSDRKEPLLSSIGRRGGLAAFGSFVAVAACLVYLNSFGRTIENNVASPAPISSDPSISEFTQQPVLVLQLGHTAEITAVAFSPDGNLLASASRDYTVKLWDVMTGRLLRTLTGHQDEVHSVAFSPNGLELASASSDQTVKLWEAETGRLKATLHHRTKVQTAIFSLDGATLISGGDDGKIAIWDLSTKTVLRVLAGHRNYVRQLALTPDGGTLVSISFDRTVRFWNPTTGRLLRTIRTRHVADDRLPNSLAVTHDGRRVAVGFSSFSTISGQSQPGDLILLWNVATGTLVGKIALGPPTDLGGVDISALAFDQSDQTVFAGSRDGRLFRIRLEGGAVESSQKPYPVMLAALALSPDSRRLASGGGDPRSGFLDPKNIETISVKIWDVANGTLLRTLAGSNSNSVTSIAFSRSGRLLVSDNRDRVVKIWDLKQGILQSGFEGKPGTFAPLTTLSPDERFLVTGVLDGNQEEGLAIWDVNAHSLAKRLEVERYGCVESASFSFDGSKILATEACNNPGRVHIWDLAGRKLLDIKAGVDGAVFTLDGTKVIAATKFGWHIDIHDALSGEYLLTLPVASPPLVLADNNTLITGSGKPSSTIKEWDISTGKLVRKVQCANVVEAIALSQDGRTLASAGWGGAIEIWDRPSGSGPMRLIRTLHSEASSINSLSFSADGRLLAAAGSDTSTMLWSVGTGELLLRLFAWPDLKWLAVAPNGLFDGTREAMAKIAWRIGNKNEVVPLDSFFTNFHHPGLLAEIIAGDTPKPPQIDMANRLPARQRVPE